MTIESLTANGPFSATSLPSTIPNYGDRWRNKERIATGFVESTVNQVISKRMVKKQQMQWTPRGAHLLLQIRTRVLNDEWGETFRTWYPGFRSLRRVWRPEPHGWGAQPQSDRPIDNRPALPAGGPWVFSPAPGAD